MDERLVEEILNVIDFSCGKTLRETQGLKSIDIIDDVVHLKVYLSEVTGEEADKVKNTLVRIVKLNYGYKGIKLQFIPEKERNTIYDNGCRFLFVASGKGGVGKSNVTANLAYALKRMGKKVGIVDCDIYGASIPNVLGLPHMEARGDKEGHILPMEAYGMEVLSTEFFVEDDRPLMWRGPMLSRMLNHFFQDTLWDKDLEYLLIDLPPGTGDVAIDLGKMLPNGKMIVVTTPHPQASSVAVKAGLGAMEMKTELIGVVENMSYFKNPANGNHEFIFGNGGGSIVSERLGVPLLSNIPIGQAKNFLFESDEDIETK